MRRVRIVGSQRRAYEKMKIKLMGEIASLVACNRNWSVLGAPERETMSRRKAYEQKGKSL
jgi:hypothetical protein